MSKKQRDFLIIGAGLSGITVATHLINKGVNVTLLDSEENYSSKVAAGMINPLVFRRMTKGWRVDEFIPFSQEFYSNLETLTGTSFFHPIQIRRMFSSEQEKELWLKKQGREDFADYMTPIEESDDNYDRAINKFGSGRVKNTSYVKTPVFLKAALGWIAEKGTVITGKINYTELENSTFRGVDYTDIIFCEGYSGLDNPFFQGLPLTATKGQTLTIKSDGIPEDESVNRKCFILPVGDQKFRVGSTYEWNDTSLNITEEGKEMILKNASYLTNAPIEIVDQATGIRPTTVDRRPLIGTHPTIHNYHFFNGLGAKGYLLAPLLAKEFVDFLLEGTPLDKEIDLRRSIS